MSSSSLFHLDAEKPFLAAAIRNPTILCEEGVNTLRPSDFSPAVNRVVFSMLQATVASEVEYSKYVLIDRLNSLNIKLGGVMEPANYINALSLLEVSEKAAVGLAREIKRTTVRREINEIGQRIVSLTAKDVHKKAAELVAEATKAFNEHINIIDGSKENEPKDLFGSIRDFLDRPTTFTERSITPPFPIFTDLYGFLDPGSVSVIVSRMKVGKSTFWLSMGQQLAAMDADDNLRILVLDTELDAEENQSRVLSSMSGVTEFRIRHGYYRKRKDELARVEAAAAEIEPLKRRVSHHYCGGLKLDEMLSVARRWAFKNLTEGKRGLIVYDYFKLNSNEDFRSKTSRDIVIGEKVDAFKRLSKELKVPALCFAQSNRENVETKGGHKQQNTAVVGGSDMIAQFGSNTYLLERLTPDERAQLNQLDDKGATHALRALVTRQLGPNEMGENHLVRYRDEKSKKDRYTDNYLLFRFDSFKVSELTTLKRVIESAQMLGTKIQPPASKGEDLV